MSRFHKGDPVEVTLDEQTTKIGRYKFHYDQYDQHEVHFADTTIWIGPASNVRTLADDEFELRAQAPKAEKPAPQGAAAETSNK